jgi:hypothetical protein
MAGPEYPKASEVPPGTAAANLRHRERPAMGESGMFVRGTASHAGRAPGALR